MTDPMTDPMTEPMTEPKGETVATRKWLVPLTSALAVVLLIATVWWFSQSGTSEDTGSAASGPAASGPDAGSAGGADGDPGGVDGGGEVPAPQEPAKLTNPVGLRIDSYVVKDSRHLVLNYTTGVPACYGELVDPPEVKEGADGVTITLSHTEVESGQACIELALLKSVSITLDAPFDQRVVRDGSFDDALVSQSADAYED